MLPCRYLIGPALAACLSLPSCGDDGQGPESGDPVCRLTPALIEFGRVNVGSYRDMTFRIENAGGGTLSGTLSESSDDYEIIGDASYALGYGEHKTFTVRFSPSSIGSKTYAVETGSVRCAAVQCLGIAQVVADYYVDADLGNDQYPGTSINPWRTITHAIASADEHTVIRVRPGTYDEALGEVFPLILKRGQTLEGDIENRGAGIAATVIYGLASVVPPFGSDKAVIQCADGSIVAGFSIGGPYASQGYGICSYNIDVTVLDNTFTSETTDLYGGVRLFGIGDATVGNNDFMTTACGVYAVNFTGSLLLEGNDLRTMSIPVDILSSSSDVIVRGNRIVGNGQVGVQVQSGTPLIEDNRFELTGGYATYGAIRCPFDTSNPTVRGNTFICARGVRIDDNASPDLGTAGDPGLNDFSGVSAAPIYHTGPATVYAIGNIWPHDVPLCGTDIVVTSTGQVIWGSGAGEQCP